MDRVSIIGVVYALSLRSPEERLEASRFPSAPGATRSPLAWLRRRSARPTGADLGFGREPAPLEREPEPEFVYVPILPSAERQWQTQVGGVVGLMLLVTAAALAVAIGIYRLGQVLNQIAQGYMG